MIISKSDKIRIRDLAKKQAEYANSDSMIALKAEWLRHNDGVAGRAMVTVEWETFAKEVVSPMIKCKGHIAKAIETKLLREVVSHELFHDDRVVNDYLSVNFWGWIKPFDIVPHAKRLKGSIAYQHKEVITDLGEDFHKLRHSTFGSVKAGQDIGIKYMEHLVGDILPVKTVGRALYAVPTQDIVHIMSLENMLFSLYDYPDEFHKMMEMISDDYIKYFDYLEKKKLILTTNANEYVAQGTCAFTSRLKGGGGPVKTTEVWGFLDSQETSSISPAMYEEFIFPYYKKIAARFGLLSYGCCEAVDPIWERCLSTLPNLAKVSISPWCNEEYMGEQLAGTNIVYQRKPSANFLGVDKELNVPEFTKHIQRTVNATKGCNLEITQRDVNTIHGNIQKVKDYVRIVREVTTK